MQQISEELNNSALNILLKKINKAKNRRDLIEFLNFFLTPQEQLKIKKRILTSIFLEQGKSYKEIGEILGASRNTVSFVKKGLKRPPKKEKTHKPITAKDLKKRGSRFPTMTGKGRWRFLDVKY